MGSLQQAQITGFLCRLCSKMHRTVIHIYGYEGTKRKLEQKINNYLPVTVTPTDLLPKTICKQCMGRVETHHKLMQKIAKSHMQLQKYQNNAGSQHDDNSSTSSSNTEATNQSVNEMSILGNHGGTIHDDDDSISSGNSE